jgi:hypothetical protein
VRREAQRLQVQEGHSIGSFGVRKAQPQFRIDFELPQRDHFGRVGGSCRFWIEVNPSYRILRDTRDRSGGRRFFPNVLTT